ncbi:MAG: hypothetical protein KAS70_01940 [Planctomycetes bacterium]|nr:hypothetical protein [Planctomycetota bacterium]
MKKITLVVLFLYFFPYLQASTHVLKIRNSSDCPACQGGAISDKPALTQSCSSEKSCDNSDHPHHNHPVHDHQSCSLCSFLNSQDIITPDITSTTFSITGKSLVITEAIHCSSFEVLSQSIRAPPIS